MTDQEKNTPETDAFEVSKYQDSTPRCVVPAEFARKLERQRNELLEALRDATNNCLWRSDNPIPLSKEESYRIWEKAMNAIAKATGKAP